MPTLDKAGNILQLNQIDVHRFPRRVIAIGDSITGRWSTGTTISNITFSNGVANVTTSGGHGSYPGGKVFISGETLSEIRARLYRDCLDYNPDLVIVEGGITVKFGKGGVWIKDSDTVVG